MYTLSHSDAIASTLPAAPKTAAANAPQPPNRADHKPDKSHVRHLLFGTPHTVHSTIRLLHNLGYAEPNDWSRPISTGKPGEVMAILTKRVVL